MHFISCFSCVSPAIIQLSRIIGLSLIYYFALLMVLRGDKDERRQRKWLSGFVLQVNL